MRPLAELESVQRSHANQQGRRYGFRWTGRVLVLTEVNTLQISRSRARSYCPAPLTRPLDDGPDRGLLALTTSERARKGPLALLRPTLLTTRQSIVFPLSIHYTPSQAAGRPYPSSPVLATLLSILPILSLWTCSLLQKRHTQTLQKRHTHTSHPLGSAHTSHLLGPVKAAGLSLIFTRSPSLATVQDVLQQLDWRDGLA